MPTNLKNYKEEKRTTLLRAHSFAKSTRAIVILFLSDKGLNDFIREAGKAIDVEFIDDSKENREGTDAFITDDWSLVPIEDLTASLIVPIGPKEGSNEKGLNEFNPMKFEGNAFLFEKNDKYQIFAALVRYLENIKYPGDKRTLLKNLHSEKSN
ncbi:MAG: hypothetical protein HHAS10_09410 [Candidatus Altimarinota bacterium]